MGQIMEYYQEISNNLYWFKYCCNLTRKEQLKLKNIKQSMYALDK